MILCRLPGKVHFSFMFKNDKKCKSLALYEGGEHC